MNLVACALMKDASYQNKQKAFEINVLDVNDKVVSSLVKKTFDFSEIRLSVQKIGI